MKKLIIIILTILFILFTIKTYSQNCPIIYYHINSTTINSYLKLSVVVDSQIYVGGEGGMVLLFAVTPILTHNNTIKIDSQSFDGNIIGDTIDFYFNSNVGQDFIVQPRWVVLTNNPPGSYIAVNFGNNLCFQKDTIYITPITLTTIHEETEESLETINKEYYNVMGQSLQYISKGLYICVTTYKYYSGETIFKSKLIFN